MKKVKKAFTLIELLVVIAIIAILAAVIAPNAFKAIEKSKVSRTLSDLKAMRTAVLQFYTDVGFFPGDVGSNVDPGLGVTPGTKSTLDASLSGMGIPSVTFYNNAVTKNWNGPYLDVRLTKGTAWAGQYDYECWWPGRESTYPRGIWITIHGVPEESAKMLVENSSFPVRSGDPTNDDITINGQRLKKVSLKIADWQN